VQWRDFPQALAMATGREVIAYDRLGFGRSSARSGLPSMGFIAEEGTLHFPALRDALGLSRYALFGHSVGGAMALAIAANDRRCEAVVTESAQAFVEERTLEGIRAARAQFADPAQLAKLERWHGDKARWVLEAWAECGWRRSSGRGASMHCCRASPARCWRSTAIATNTGRRRFHTASPTLRAARRKRSSSKAAATCRIASGARRCCNSRPGTWRHAMSRDFR
jgi:pimeloyl-ACP methyl ester carboxylesterase